MALNSHTQTHHDWGLASVFSMKITYIHTYIHTFSEPTAFDLVCLPFGISLSMLSRNSSVLLTPVFLDASSLLLSCTGSLRSRY